MDLLGCEIVHVEDPTRFCPSCSWIAIESFWRAKHSWVFPKTIPFYQGQWPTAVLFATTLVLTLTKHPYTASVSPGHLGLNCRPRAENGRKTKGGGFDGLKRIQGVWVSRSVRPRRVSPFAVGKCPGGVGTLQDGLRRIHLSVQFAMRVGWLIFF